MEGFVTGFYGKIPSHGDFISRSLPRTFIDPWDQWLQESISRSKQDLGDAWLDCYLMSPMWRFALCAGICGPDGWAGVMIPSVDKVGRYFPLTIATRTGSEPNWLALALTREDWFARAESLALSVLDDDSFDLSMFEKDIETHAWEKTPSQNQWDESQRDAHCWRLPLGSLAELRDRFAIVACQVLDLEQDGSTLWWTDGSDKVQAQLLHCQQLPEASIYSSMIGGD